MVSTNTKERDESRRPDPSDESFFPGEYFDGDKESRSGWDRSYLVHDATPQAHCWSSSEDSDDLIENRQSWHHGEEKRGEEEVYKCKRQK